MVASTPTFRKEVQGLRAVAVGLVLFFHIWPSLLPGGYVGVDVFFVISGFLITSLLLREYDRDGSISLLRFYVRRARRLLPAAFFVLLISFMVSVWLLPAAVWVPFRAEFIAATLYVENWFLAFQSVDYLAAESEPSPVQHYWSLSIEEQFYLVWPFLVLACLARSAGRRSSLQVVIIVAVLVSAVMGVLAARQGDPSAYFTTHTRVWQLGCGALLAALPERRWGVGEIVAGLALILFSASQFSGDTSYPGYAAIVPTLGAMLVIGGGRSFLDSNLTGWLGSRAATWVGDISYSLYLWHWPVVVLAKHVWNIDKFGAWDGIAALATSVLLAHLTKIWVEDRFRIVRSGRDAFVLSRYVGASVAFASVFFFVGMRAGAGPEVMLPVDDDNYPGATAFLLNRELPQVPLRPTPFEAGKDLATAYAQGCIQGGRRADVSVCAYGNPRAPVRIAVVGDSHAVHWLPAFEWLAEHYNVYVEGLTKTSCSPAGVDVYARTSDGPYSSCTQWSEDVKSYIKDGRFNYLVLSQSPKHRLFELRDQPPARSAAPLAAALARTWEDIARTTPTYIIRPTPWQPTAVPGCAAGTESPFTECTAGPEETLENDALTRLAEMIPATLLDFTDLLCRDGVCPAVIGNVFVYRDAHHLTRTFNRTLAEPLLNRAGWTFERHEERAKKLGFDGVLPHPAVAVKDRPASISDGCVRSSRVDSVKSCTFGVDGGQVRVAIVGDATGANLIPGLEGAAEEFGWEIRTFFKDSCVFGRAAVHHRLLKGPYTGCVDWSQRVVSALKRDMPDIILVAQSPMYRLPEHSHPSESGAVLAQSISTELEPFIEAGVRVVAFTGLPWFPTDQTLCALDNGAVACTFPAEEVTPLGLLDHLAEHSPAVIGVNLSELFCPSGSCPPILGEVFVYRDSHQPTATFMEGSQGWFVEHLGNVLSKTGPQGASR